MAHILPYSIRRALVLLVLATVLPGMAILLYSSQQLEDQAVEEVEGFALRQVQTMASHHQRVLDNARLLLATLAQTAECQGADPAASQALLGQVLGLHTAYVGLALADPQGRILAAAPPGYFNGPVREPYLAQAVEGSGFALGDYSMRQDKMGVVIHLAQAVQDRQGRVTAVLVAAFDFNYLVKIFLDAHLPEGSVLTITDASGMRLTRFPETEKYTHVPDLPRMIERMSGPAEEGTFLETGVDEVRRLYAFKRQVIPGAAFAHLMLRLGIPVEQALAEASALLWRSLALLGLSCFLSLGLAWLFSEFTILRPLRKLAAAAQGLGGGDLSARTGLGHYRGELGRLAQSFDDMAESLEKRERETLDAQHDIQRLLKDKSDCLDRLARCVAHEVRNPVTTIGGLARRLLNQVEQGDTSAEYLRKILADTQRLEKIVREVREYADLPLPCPRTEDLGMLLADLAGPFAVHAEQAGVSLTCLGEVGRPGVVVAWVDRRLLEKTIKVLLANGLEAMPQGGELRLMLERDQNNAIVTVADTGVGIAGQDMPYLFDPFFTTKAQAVGINLSTVKRIASEHHWDIQVESQPGQGTTFTLTIPLFPSELIGETSEEA